jgi:hypothetical protein
MILNNMGRSKLLKVLYCPFPESMQLLNAWCSKVAAQNFLIFCRVCYYYRLCFTEWFLDIRENAKDAVKR